MLAVRHLITILGTLVPRQKSKQNDHYRSTLEEKRLEHAIGSAVTATKLLLHCVILKGGMTTIRGD